MQSLNNKIWRFIDTGAADGAFNMAVDEGLARCTNSAEPILRVYRWQPFTISIGYHQNLDELDLNKCKKDGVDVVRRPTGGRAIFHAHEVTYSIIIPKQSVWYANKTLEIYNHISSALVKGLQYIGMPVKLDRKDHYEPDFADYNQRFACFASTAKYEIQYQSKKLVGSAQRRFENALLQHGSIILGNEHLNLLNYLSTNGNGQLMKARQRLQEKTICIETILMRSVSYEEVVSNLKTGFEKYFDVNFQCRHLTSDELQKIEELKTKITELRRNLL
ncbi:MAG: biotin/lipoate A/B protein ligase family protein [bacterium]